MIHFRSQNKYKLTPIIVSFFTPEGFTTLVTNEGLEKARAYINQIPRDEWMQCKLQVNSGQS